MEFVRRFQRLISSVVRRIAARRGETRAAVIEELVQDTYLKVCANDRRLLREFRSQHPDAFYGMLKVTAASVVYDHFRAVTAPKRSSGLPELDLSEVEPFVSNANAAGPEAIEREVLLQQIDKALAAIPSASAERDRTIFWLRYRQGLSARDIASVAAFGLTDKGVESLLSRLICQVKLCLLAQPAPVPKPARQTKGIRLRKSLEKGEGRQ